MVEGERSWTNGASVSYFDNDGERTDPLESNKVTIRTDGTDDPGNPDDPDNPFVPEDPGDFDDPTGPKPLPDPDQKPPTGKLSDALVQAGDMLPMAALSLVTALLAVALVVVGRKAFGKR